MVLHDLTRRSVQVSRSGIVTEPLPMSQDLLFARLCEGGHIGEPSHPSVKIWDYASYPRLLQQHLRNEHPIRVAIPSPW